MIEGLISVVVPVYNVEKYISRCVDSVLKQTYTNWELILINDGSSDKSGTICDEYASNDSRIRVIHQKNSGPSVARNNGVACANGEYIAFLDSDDWLYPEMYQKLINAAKEYDADMVKCGFDYTNGVEHSITTEPMRVFENDIMDNYFNGVLWIVVWNAIYKASIAKKVIYPQGYDAEDNYTSFFYLYYAKKVVMLPDVCYNYYRNNSGFRSKVKLWSKAKLELMTYLLNDIKNKGIELPDKFSKKMKYYYARDWFHRIRDDNSIKSIDNCTSKLIFDNLDFRRAIQLRIILLARRVLSAYL